MQSQDGTAVPLKTGVVVRGALFPEPVRIITTTRMGTYLKLVGEGVHSGDLRQAVLSPA